MTPESSGSTGGGYAPFAHLTAPNAVLYRRLMRTFLTAKERFAVHLRPEDVYAALPPEHRPSDLDAVMKALDRLAEWGNLRADPDTSRVTAVEDFYRKRFIYQLTQAGEAAEQALSAYDEALGRRGALQAVALHDIVTQLRALLVIAAELEEGEPDAAKAHLALSALTGRFEALAENARAFMGSLQRTVDLHGVQVEVFLAYKDRLIQYLERFIQDLITLGGRIAVLIGELEQDGRARALLRLAAAREATDAAPEDAETAEEEAYARWAAKWSGLAAWFVSADGRESQARLLRSRALGAIPQLLTVVRQLNERRAGRSDRSADFRTLARWFAEAPDDEARHRLWRAAFGLYSARHLAVDAETLAQRTARPVAPSTPWAEAEPLRISPQLRRTGSYERRGRARRVTDRSEQRRELAEIAAKQAREIAAARARLATDGATRLSALGELDPMAFGLFLQLLGDALATWRPGTKSTVATSNDGSMEIRLTALADGTTAEIRTPGGVFSGPDHLVEITDLTGPEATYEEVHP
ncbi:TIGR02677 family protein [Streptomyces cinnamoneus]|uniref:TIGR02677 family protein n=1 Tax=Streptomyces cinnamoneus TaxID=53446 RepID=A0A2G1X9K7_STRCJ|nr:TIGR02677 family protein [Streptomyces cinnamoneus]PHQ47908.1 TIGR02677 family protein [Streptomyces cinnamoneus]PPT15533.1 TIGR02677 family protein [Streptomyces cinnamoneus]